MGESNPASNRMLVCVLDPRALAMAYDFRTCAVVPEGYGVENDLSVILAGMWMW